MRAMNYLNFCCSWCLFCRLMQTLACRVECRAASHGSNIIRDAGIAELAVTAVPGGTDCWSSNVRLLTSKPATRVESFSCRSAISVLSASFFEVSVSASNSSCASFTANSAACFSSFWSGVSRNCSKTGHQMCDHRVPVTGGQDGPVPSHLWPYCI